MATMPYEQMEAAVVAQFERCKSLARVYLYFRYTGTGDINRTGENLYREAVEFARLCKVGGIERLTTLIEGAPVPLAKLSLQQIEQCGDALLMPALAVMGMEPDRQTALDEFN